MYTNPVSWSSCRFFWEWSRQSLNLELRFLSICSLSLCWNWFPMSSLSRGSKCRNVGIWSADWFSFTVKAYLHKFMFTLQVFSYTANKEIRTDDLCLDVSKLNGPVTMLKCHHLKGNQLWEYDPVVSSPVAYRYRSYSVWADLQLVWFIVTVTVITAIRYIPNIPCLFLDVCRCHRECDCLLS